MKKLIMIILALALCTAMILPASAEGRVSITLSETELTVGTGVKLKLEVSTESTEKLKYTWESTDKKIAAVDGKGTVSGVAEGEATITCSAVLGKEVVATAACKVTVFTSVKSVKAASPVKGNILFINQPVQIAAAIAPDNAAYQKLIWTSSDEGIATVDENGVVTALQPGKVKITCETDQPNQAKAITANVQFTVKQQVEEIKLNAEKLVLWLKDTVPDGTDTAEITVEEVLPENANDRKVKWEISDKKIADMKNGKITAKKAGSCTVTVTAADGGGAAAECQVYVLGPSAYRFSASALKDTTVAFTEDAEKATETAGVIIRTALERLAEIENTSRYAALSYFIRTAAANGTAYLTGSADDAAFPVTVVMASDADTCAVLTYDSDWNTFYFSTARHLTGNDFAQVQLDGAAILEMIPGSAAEGE